MGLTLQTFLPYSDFRKSAQVLDYRRLGKQRVEALQIFKALTTENYGWSNHPIVRMWKGYENALLEYKNIMIQEWIDRGFNNNMRMETNIEPRIYPPWLGNNELHASHRSNLLEKDFNFYSRFNWDEEPGREYIWIIPEDSK